MTLLWRSLLKRLLVALIAEQLQGGTKRSSQDPTTKGLTTCSKLETIHRPYRRGKLREAEPCVAAAHWTMELRQPGKVSVNPKLVDATNNIAGQETRLKMSKRLAASASSYSFLLHDS